MAGILELDRQKLHIKRELLRRIGYTNGLHHIDRFARVVEYLFPIIPTTTATFQSVIIEDEKSFTGVSGRKYAQGIIDVSGALLLIIRAGQKLTLSDRGYALHAVEQLDHKESNQRAFLLMSVLDSDGEYVINLLDMVNKGICGIINLGKNLVDRMLMIIEIKEQWARRSIHSPFAQDLVKGSLQEARSVLQKAVDPDQKVMTKSRATLEERQLSPEKRVERFFEHTVKPRLQWLVDLGCVEKDGDHLLVTDTGLRLLSFFNSLGCRRDNNVYVLPISDWLSEVLDADNLVDAKAIFWRAVAFAYTGQALSYRSQGHELLQSIKNIYAHVKMSGFNQAEISSVFHALSCTESLNGSFLDEDYFEEDILHLVKNYPREIFRLSKRRGRGGYFAIK